MRESNLKPVDVSYVGAFSPEDLANRQYSTLDLCEFNKFTLIGNLDVRGVKTCRVGQDFELVGEAGQQWLQGARLDVAGGLLVRPDQHILMVLRADTAPEDVELCIRQHLSL